MIDRQFRDRFDKSRQNSVFDAAKQVQGVRVNLLPHECGQLLNLRHRPVRKTEQHVTLIKTKVKFCR